MTKLSDAEIECVSGGDPVADAIADALAAAIAALQNDDSVRRGCSCVR